jgi:glucosylceramidase
MGRTVFIKEHKVMYWKSSFRLCALSVLLSIVPSTHAQELLTNPGFEEGTNTIPWNETIPPTGWQKYGNWGWAGWKQNINFPSHTGTKYVDAGAWTYGEYGVWYQDINVDAGEAYICSIWSRIEGWGSDPHASMIMEFRDASNRVLLTDRLDIFTGTPPNPNVWAQYVFTTRPAPANTAYARYLLRGEARCTAMFDDASVTAVGLQRSSDFNDDGFVNFPDYAEMAQAWLFDCNEPHCVMYDLDNSGTIDKGDLKNFTEEWLTYDEYVTIDINEMVTFQEMDGFGASLTESSAYLIHSALTEQQRQELMLDLFDAEIGIGLSYLRQPMGASDFRLSDYTYDDMPAGQTDYGLVNFSIGRDQTHIIPLLQIAVAINPDIKIMGSPWSAPAWMKNSGQLGYGRLIDSDAIYDTYANYFVKYVQAYAAAGLSIDAVTLQNEPYHEPYGYPGMRMEPADQVRLVIYMGPKFQANNINTKIVVWDHNWDNPGYPITVLNNPEANPYIAGSAFHAYAGDVSAQLQVVSAHPDKDIYFTECSGGDWSTNFGNNLMWDTSTLIIKAVRYYAKTVVKWNLALDQDHGPKIGGGCGNCRGVVTINRYSGEVTREVEYYSLGHAAKFVKPGAFRIDSTEQPGQNLENVAFVNRDGSIAVIVLNPNTFRQNVELKWKGWAFIYGLPSRSVTTFRWPNENNAMVEVWTTTADQTKLLQRQTGARFYFLPLPDQASNPNPPDGAIDVNPDSDLSWTAGSYTYSHDVYFGMTNPPPFSHNQRTSTFDPGLMFPQTKYYWRIDEINSSGTTTGIVWSFTTEEVPPPI